jgi:hypothetical protein
VEILIPIVEIQMKWNIQNLPIDKLKIFIPLKFTTFPRLKFFYL